MTAKVEHLASNNLSPHTITLTEAEPLYRSAFTSSGNFSNIYNCMRRIKREVFSCVEQLSEMTGIQMAMRQGIHNNYSELFRIWNATVSIHIRKYNFSSCVGMFTQASATLSLKRKDYSGGNASAILQTLSQKLQSLHQSESTYIFRTGYYTAIICDNIDPWYVNKSNFSKTSKPQT